MLSATCLRERPETNRRTPPFSMLSRSQHLHWRGRRRTWTVRLMVTDFRVSPSCVCMNRVPSALPSFSKATVVLLFSKATVLSIIQIKQRSFHHSDQGDLHRPSYTSQIPFNSKSVMSYALASAPTMMLPSLIFLFLLFCTVFAQSKPNITLPWGTWQASKYDSNGDVSNDRP